MKRSQNRNLPTLHEGLQKWTLATVGWLCAWLASFPMAAAVPTTVSSTYTTRAEPILKKHCYDCHGEGMEKGRVAFDTFKSDSDRMAAKDFWLTVLKNVRAGLMPPEKKARPTAEEIQTLTGWIREEVFGGDSENPDPGRVTVRRLNRIEYRNTIRDLMGIEFDVDQEFPADDTGHGFDNLGEALNMSPMLVEKYLEAARSIVRDAVPTTARTPVKKRIGGSRFRVGTNGLSEVPASLPYYDPAKASHSVKLETGGLYRVRIEFTATEKAVEDLFDRNRCILVFRTDGVELFRREFSREPHRSFQFEYVRQWEAGSHELEFEIQPQTPAEPRVRSLAIRIQSVTLIGPESEDIWERPQGFARFFTGDAPADPPGRRVMASALLRRFATKAYRRPVEDRTVGRLVDLAERGWKEPGATFESGVAQAMVGVLASPRFLLREERPEEQPAAGRHPLIDEYSLASRLSYFLWSTMPDERLMTLAGEKRLREELPAEIRRMLADSKAEALVRNFTGQWLQARDIEGIAIDHRTVMERESDPDPELEKLRRRFRELRERKSPLTDAEKKELEQARQGFLKHRERLNVHELTGDVRRAMRQETEKYFEHVLREDRSLLELLDSDYTFLNERLAKHYGIPGVEGDRMRKVTLPADSPRGGVLTHGTVLTVTSNPTRTSPVKRGLFLLENFLGTPPPPPPANVPALEAVKKSDGKDPALREALAIHRADPLCHSCHNRMDPLGLAFENFNALGRWREKDLGTSIDPAGRLVTGESFTGVKELKKILVRNRRDDFYRSITEKLLIYALGRGLGYEDEGTVEKISGALGANGGRASVLLEGILNSVPFQRMRTAAVGEGRAGEALQVRRE